MKQLTLHNADSAANDDRRENLRQTLRPLAVSIEGAQVGRHDGTLLDLSRSGLRFRADFCFPCGGTVLIHPPDGAGLLPIRAKVVRQRLLEEEGENGFEYGARFTEEAELRRHAWWLELRRAA